MQYSCDNQTKLIELQLLGPTRDTEQFDPSIFRDKVISFIGNDMITIIDNFCRVNGSLCVQAIL